MESLEQFVFDLIRDGNSGGIRIEHTFEIQIRKTLNSKYTKFYHYIKALLQVGKNGTNICS